MIIRKIKKPKNSHHFKKTFCGDKGSYAFNKSCKSIFGNFLIVHPNALSNSGNVWRSIQSNVVTCAMKNVREHCADRSFAICATDVQNSSKMFFRMPQFLEKVACCVKIPFSFNSVFFLERFKPCNCLLVV